MNIEELEQIVRETDLIITVSDAREYFGGCIPGWRTFSTQFGFNWKETIRRGLLASKLLETKDVMAYNLVTYVYTREHIL
jgi:hypothetical protein